MSEHEKLIANIQQEMKRGSLVLAVLLLMDQPQYGYSLIQALNDSGIAIEQNTLYPLLRRLEKQGLLESIWQVEENRPRRYYQISALGKDFRIELIQEWQGLNSAMSHLIKKEAKMIDSYLYTIGKSLPPKGRAEILEEIKSNLYDYLEENYGQKAYSLEEETAAIKALGHPKAVAQAYNKASDYLIGPGYIDLYWLVLKLP